MQVRGRAACSLSHGEEVRKVFPELLPRGAWRTRQFSQLVPLSLPTLRKNNKKNKSRARKNVCFLSSFK